MIKFEAGCHWYDCSGTPAPKHDADLRVARKARLYPSVTTVDKDVFKNDFLDRWKMNQLALAASQNPRQPHESEERYCNRIYEFSLDKSKTASEFGKKIHSAIEGYPNLPADTNLHPWVYKFAQWYDVNVERALFREEILLDHDLGVAGTCDFIGHGRGSLGGVIIPDWKTQDVKRDEKGRKKPAYYDSWTRQLGFYSVCYAKRAGTFPHDIPTCISVIIDSNAPVEGEEFNPIHYRVWKKEEIIDAYMDFVAGAYLWFSKRNYWPQPSQKLSLNPSIPMPISA